MSEIRPEPKNTIDEILAEAIDRSVVGEDRANLFNQAKQALYQDLLELVGEDEPFKNLYQWSEAEPINLEKQRIRAKLKQYFGKER